MGPRKQRGRPIKIDQYAGLPSMKQRQPAESAEIEFDEEGFLNFMKMLPQPSDHVPPAPPAPPVPAVRAPQLDPQSQHPETVDEPTIFVDDAFEPFEAASNETVEFRGDTDSDTDKEDLEFCVVGADGLLTDAPSKHHQRESQKFISFDIHKAGMLAEYAKLVTANLTGCLCSVSGCESASNYRCYTCRSGGTLKSTYCELHARTHWKECICHKILDASDQPLQRNLRRLDCCEMSPVHGGHVLQLSTQDCSEQVTCHTCSNHGILSLLMGSLFLTDHAFSIPMVQVALKSRIHRTSYKSCAGIFFSDSSKSARNKGLYQPFMDSVRFFSGLSQAVHHGTVHAPDAVGWGKTRARGLSNMVGATITGNTVGLVNSGTNLAKTMLLEPVRKDSLLQWTVLAAHPGTIQEKKRDSLERNEISKANMIELSIKAACMTSSSEFQYVQLFHSVLQILILFVTDAKGERLLYCDTAIEMIREQYPNRELALSYDVMCKEVAHLQQPYMLQTKIEMPYIAVLPAMHAQAHSKE
ncbi:hypothetical protein HDU77_010073 [Chytriomyces hyalinus]|nr:hypothetical protein HDU77_010073 [Chytriomyces hyalinus]